MLDHVVTQSGELFRIPWNQIYTRVQNLRQELQYASQKKAIRHSASRSHLQPSCFLAGNTMYISGCTARGTDSQGKSVMEQLDVTLNRLISIAAEEGAGPGSVAKAGA